MTGAVISSILAILLCLLSLIAVLANFLGSYIEEVAAKSNDAIDEIAERLVSEYRIVFHAIYTVSHKKVLCCFRL